MKKNPSKTQYKAKQQNREIDPTNGTKPERGSPRGKKSTRQKKGAQRAHLRNSLSMDSSPGLNEREQARREDRAGEWGLERKGLGGGS